MSDLVSLLRRINADFNGRKFCTEAADEVERLTRELAASQDSHTRISLAIVHAGVSSFGWNHEGVEKLGAKLAASEVYAEQLAAALREAHRAFLWIKVAVFGASAECIAGYARGAAAEIDAALAKNPNPAGLANGVEAVERSAASGLVGLGPKGWRCLACNVQELDSEILPLACLFCHSTSVVWAQVSRPEEVKPAQGNSRGECYSGSLYCANCTFNGGDLPCGIPKGTLEGRDHK